MGRLNNPQVAGANHRTRILDIDRSLSALYFEILKIAFLPMNHFVTSEICSDVPVAGDYTVCTRNLVEPNPVAVRPCALHHSSALGGSEKRNGQGFVSVG